ncbi:MAG: TetR-like C-terminal domain-containing protein [Eubacteriales bacterium]|nr:TetR-like C-terminal domain-containing protein [Eubacteriales bacterium]
MKKPETYIENALIHFLETENMDRITVSMVCGYCGVSRQSLYYHYDSLMDAFRSWLYLGVTEEMDGNRTYKTWTCGFMNIMKFCERNRGIIRNVYDSSYRDELKEEIWDFGNRLIGQAIEDVTSDTETPLLPHDKKFMQDFYMSVFFSIVTRYIAGEIHESPEYIVSRCEVMMGGSIEDSERKLKELYRES